ncbi:MAG: type II toxin-antitoxin system VapC family toxin [Planctomycetes bacterium]|nr:type II toxin-antitoxin system VapC family toxin [Planctomycetota bacterium]
MKRYLLDTGIAGHYVAKRRGVFQRVCDEALRGNRIGICSPVLGELWDGVEYSATRDRNAKRLRIMLPKLLVWPYEKTAAEMYGKISAELRRIGRPMQQIDIQIAAIAFALGNCTVVTADSDFSAIDGLPVENWAV